MNSLIEIIRKSINELNGNITEQRVTTEFLNKLTSKFNPQEISTISKEELDYIKTLELSDQERKFIYAFSNPDARSIFESFGLDANQWDIMKSIRQKLIQVMSENTKTSNLLDKLNKYKELLSTMENPNKSLVSNIALVREVLTEAKVPLEEQIKIILDINKSNINFYNRPSAVTVTVRDENDLEVTNIDKGEVTKILKKYGIDFSFMPEKLQNRLLKYGKLDKIEGILELLKSNKLHSLFNQYEILVKTLVYSDVEKISNVIKICNENNLYNFINKYPTVLFPEISEHTSRVARGTGLDTVITGSYNKFCANVEFFESIGSSAKEVFDKCSTLLTWSDKAMKRAYATVRLYGITDEEVRSTLSILLGSSHAKAMDIAIENKAHPYILDNLSRLAEPFNMFRIKLNAKFIQNRDTRRIPEPFNMRIKDGASKFVVKTVFSERKPRNPFGDNEQETFRLYDAKSIADYIPQYDVEKYNEVLEKADTTVVDPSIETSEFIRNLDELYMADEKPWYNIDGVIISRIKVLRYLSAFMNNNLPLNDDSKLYILSKDSMLDASEFEKLQKALKRVKGVTL